METKNISLFDVEWALIAPLIEGQRRAQAQIDAYLSITAARAGGHGITYALDISKRELVPVYTKEQTDNLLAGKVDLEAIGK